MYLCTWILRFCKKQRKPTCKSVYLCEAVLGCMTYVCNSVFFNLWIFLSSDIVGHWNGGSINRLLQRRVSFWCLLNRQNPVAFGAISSLITSFRFPQPTLSCHLRFSLHSQLPGMLAACIPLHTTCGVKRLKRGFFWRNVLSEMWLWTPSMLPCL